MRWRKWGTGSEKGSLSPIGIWTGFPGKGCVEGPKKMLRISNLGGKMWAKLGVRGGKTQVERGRRPSGPGLSLDQSWHGRGQGHSHWVLNAGRSLLCDQTASCPFRLRPPHSHPGEHARNVGAVSRTPRVRGWGPRDSSGRAGSVPLPANLLLSVQGGPSLSPLPEELSPVFVWLMVKVHWPSPFRQFCH